jgi:hypothetical protein
MPNGRADVESTVPKDFFANSSHVRGATKYVGGFLFPQLKTAGLHSLGEQVRISRPLKNLTKSAVMEPASLNPCNPGIGREHCMNMAFTALAYCSSNLVCGACGLGDSQASGRQVYLVPIATLGSVVLFHCAAAEAPSLRTCSKFCLASRAAIYSHDNADHKS